MKRTFTLPSSLALSLGLLLPLGQAYPQIGIVISTKGKTWATGSSGRINLKRGTPLKQGYTLHTDKKSRIQFRLKDGTLVGVRPKSSYRLAKFRFNQDKPSQNQLAVELATGSFRAITGTINKGNPKAFTVTTPVATLGVRGTVFSISTSSKRSDVSVDDGELEASPKRGSKKIILTKKQKKVEGAEQPEAPENAVITATDVKKTSKRSENIEDSVRFPGDEKVEGDEERTTSNEDGSVQDSISSRDDIVRNDLLRSNDLSSGTAGQDAGTPGPAPSPPQDTDPPLQEPLFAPPIAPPPPLIAGGLGTPGTGLTIFGVDMPTAMTFKNHAKGVMGRSDFFGHIFYANNNVVPNIATPPGNKDFFSPYTSFNTDEPTQIPVGTMINSVLGPREGTFNSGLGLSNLGINPGTVPNTNPADHIEWGYWLDSNPEFCDGYASGCNVPLDPQSRVVYYIGRQTAPATPTAGPRTYNSDLFVIASNQNQERLTAQSASFTVDFVAETVSANIQLTRSGESYHLNTVTPNSEFFNNYSGGVATGFTFKGSGSFNSNPLEGDVVGILAGGAVEQLIGSFHMNEVGGSHMAEGIFRATG